jgi:uncharacterized protein (DUF779 family)
MSERAAPPRVAASTAALEAIDRLQADRGPLMFYQSGGCCDGSLPICLEDGELVTGDGDVLLGEVAGCPFYIDARQDAAWGKPRLVLDVAPGAPEGFSLAAGDDRHFVTVTLPVHPGPMPAGAREDGCPSARQPWPGGR